MCNVHEAGLKAMHAGQTSEQTKMQTKTETVATGSNRWEDFDGGKNTKIIKSTQHVNEKKQNL